MRENMDLLICTRKLSDMSFKIVAISCANPVQCQRETGRICVICSDFPSAHGGFKSLNYNKKL